MSGKAIKTELFCPDEIPTEIRSGIEKASDGIFRHEGLIYLALEQKIICCEDSKDGNELIRSLVPATRGAQEQPKSKTAVLLCILNNPAYIPDSALMKRYRIDPDAGGTVTVFQSSSPLDKDLASVFSTMVPLEAGDLILPADHDTVIFIRELSHPYSDELKEYTEAVIGTMESEGITGISAGIGNGYPGVEGLRKSYLEAKEALSVGIRFHGKENVYCYAGQTLERILDSIPKDKAQEIRREHPGICSDSGLSDEIKETVRVFFQNDLNLTAASRQLFIHRNTLNYRLDKIRRETGLDLRSFHDAVIFRILSGLQEKE